MAARVEEVQKQHPSADLKVEEKWWVPTVDFGIYLKVPKHGPFRLPDLVSSA